MAEGKGTTGKTGWLRRWPAIAAIALLVIASCAFSHVAPASADTPVVTLTDPIKRGSLKIQKIDADTSTSTPQGNAVFSGAKFEIVNASANPVVVGGVLYDKSAVVATVTTDSSGSATCSDLPYGTYTVRETQEPAGYLKNDGWAKTVQVRDDGATVDVPDCVEPVKRGSVTLGKTDADTGASIPEGDATFVGATFTIKNVSANPVYVNGHLYAVQADVGSVSITDGSTCTFTDLPYGTYTVRETSAPDGYHANTTWSKTFSVTYDGEVVDLRAQPVPDPVWRGKVKLRKADDDNRTSVPQGDATFKGAQFTIVNRSRNQVKVGGAVYQTGSAVGTCTVPDDTGAIEFGDLPYGTYEVTETKAPDYGYFTDPDWKRTFTIRSDGQVVDLTGDPDAVYDPVYRGGLEVLKVDKDTMEPVPEGDASLEGTVFKVYNISRRSVMAGTPGNRQSYAPLPKLLGKWVTAGAIPVATLTTDEHAFCSLPSTYLPYGTYLIVEDSAPYGYLMNHMFHEGVEFTIREDGQVYQFTHAEPPEDIIVPGT